MSPRRALLMASGANRGAYYAGFLEPLQEAGIDFDILAGVSAGGIASAWFGAADAQALISSWKEASRWKISFHPRLSRGMSRTVDELIRRITLQIMDVEAARMARPEIRLALSHVLGRRWPFPRLSREIFSNRRARDAEEFGRMLRATAFVPWVNGLRASIEIGGERYIDGGLVGRVPLEMIRPGEVDEIWASHCGWTRSADLDSTQTGGYSTDTMAEIEIDLGTGTDPVWVAVGQVYDGSGDPGSDSNSVASSVISRASLGYLMDLFSDGFETGDTTMWSGGTL